MTKGWRVDCHDKLANEINRDVVFFFGYVQISYALDLPILPTGTSSSKMADNLCASAKERNYSSEGGYSSGAEKLAKINGRQSVRAFCSPRDILEKAWSLNI